MTDFALANNWIIILLYFDVLNMAGKKVFTEEKRGIIVSRK